MEPTAFERALRTPPERVVIRHQRAKLLRRILEFARLTIDQVVNDPRCKVAVLRWYRVADACEWESRRTYLESRVSFDRWVRETR